MRVRWVQFAIVGLFAGGLFLTANAAGHAHGLTKLLKEAGDAGQDAATTAPRLSTSALDQATAVLRRLPVTGESRLALAVQVTPEGH